MPWWPGSIVSDGGVHMHHLFFGIAPMMTAGGLSFAAGETDGPWYAIYAVLFGVGFGLAINEYALWSTSTTSTGRTRAAARSTPR